MLSDLMHATFSVLLLTLFIAFVYLTFTDLPLEPFLVGEAIGMPTGIAILTLASPRRAR